MDFHAIFQVLVANLGFGAAGAILIYAIAVVLDILAGLILALKQRTLNRVKLGSFLESQVGVRRTLIVIGAVGTAVIAVVASASTAGASMSQVLAVVKDAALAAAAAGAAANFVAVAGDILEKLGALVGSSAPAALPSAPAK